VGAWDRGEDSEEPTAPRLLQRRSTFFQGLPMSKARQPALFMRYYVIFLALKLTTCGYQNAFLSDMSSAHSSPARSNPRLSWPSKPSYRR
jgi:hypothetical protein